MSTIRDDVLRTKALQDMDINAEIKDIKCELDYKFKWDGEVTNLFTSMRGSRYTSMYGDWFITKEKSEQYFNDELNVIDMIKRKHINQNEFNKVRKYKNVSSDVYLVVTVYYKLSYMDGESLWASETIEINEENCFSYLLSYINMTDERVYAEVKNEDICVIFGDSETILKSVDEPVSNMNSTEEFMLQYLSEPEKWVDCRINEIETNEDSISIPVSINNISIEFIFSNPEDNKSPVWDFANEFNYDDPWNLQNEDAQISIHSITNKSYYQDEFWNIRRPRTKIFAGIKSKIRKILA